jgi:aminoglycoside phosphotransferase (APT) family kinase protein
MAYGDWRADVELTAEGAARLIAAQFPELAPARLDLLGEGWDNTAYVVNGRWAFRFPRRHMGADLLAVECRALPLLAPRLPLPVPSPAFVGEPADGYPYPFAGYEMLPGVTADRVEWSHEERAACAPALGVFLGALRAMPVDAETAAWAPGDTIHRADRTRRAPALKERLATVAPGVLGAEAAAALPALVDRLSAAPAWGGPPCWVHGDLYVRHLLADPETKRPTGVIDWGDVHLGDPALDLSLAFGFLPPEARGAFAAAYGRPISAADRDRARFRALHYGAVLIPYGREKRDHALLAAGEAALRGASGGDGDLTF